MTKDEAVEILKHCGAEPHCVDYYHWNCTYCNQRIAQNMAIEALKTKPGHWANGGIEYCYCSECGTFYEKTLVDQIGFDYCPHCGAKMGERKEE